MKNEDESFNSKIDLIKSKLNILSLNDDIQDNIASIKGEINSILNNIQKLYNYNTYENILKKYETIIRTLYSDLLHEKLMKEVLEDKIAVYVKMQKEYELIKEKTGAIVWEGKVISNERKDNEINILRRENSILKNVITEKEKEIKKLKNELSNNKLIENNNFSSTSRNFYKPQKLENKILNGYQNMKNKNIETISVSSINKNINHQSKKNFDKAKEKLISVNKNKFNKKLSRNRGTNSNMNIYASCENINKKNKNQINNNNKTIINNKSKHKKQIIYPMREYNSVRYINTQSSNNKENVNNNVIISNKIKNKKNKNEKSIRHDNSFKDNFHIFFQKTYDSGFYMRSKK
jgi:hypothetical protein